MVLVGWLMRIIHPPISSLLKAKGCHRTTVTWFIPDHGTYRYWFRTFASFQPSSDFGVVGGAHPTEADALQKAMRC